jgi:hypothetical protein
VVRNVDVNEVHTSARAGARQAPARLERLPREPGKIPGSHRDRYG